MNYFHTTTITPDINCLKEALQKAFQLAIQSKTFQVLIEIGSIGHFPPDLEKILGRKIKSKESLVINAGDFQIDIFVESHKTEFKSGFKRGVKMKLYGSYQGAQDLTNDRRVVEMIYIPWLSSDLKPYIDNVSSTPIN